MYKILKFIYQRTLKKIFPDTKEIIGRILRTELKDCQSVLDLGCGPSSPLKYTKDELGGLYSVGVDIFEPYISDQPVTEKIHSRYLKANIFELDFPDKSFDSAILIDVIEHFKKDDFLNFLPKLEKMVKKIIIITPNGFIEQEGYDNNGYQAHLSGWTVSDLTTLGFSCRGLSGLKLLREEKWQPRIKPVLLGEIISNLTQPLVSHCPRLAYHLVAIKEIND